MNHRNAAKLLLAAAAGTSSAQLTVDFEGLSHGTVLTDQLVLMTFSSTEGNQVTVGGSASNQFICSGAIGEVPNCTEEIIIDFDPPVNGLTFEVIQANLPGYAAKFDATYQGTGLHSIWFESSGAPLQHFTRFADTPAISRLRIRDISDDPAEAGIAWDTFRFTPVPEGSSRYHPFEIQALPYVGTFNNSSVEPNGPAGTCNSVEADAMENAMWFRYVPSQSGPLNVAVDSNNGFQTIAAVHRQESNNRLTAIGCDALADPLAITITSEAGVPLFIQVGDWGTMPGGGAFELSVTETCLADVNGDGDVNPADFNAWVIAFNNDTVQCDQNGDGLCNPADFNAWVINFNDGC